MNIPSYAPLHRDFLLDPDIVFLNHGSFGACPRPVLDHQSRLRERMERQPILFLDQELWSGLDASRRALAPVLGTAPDRLSFVSNATSGVNAVLRSLRFQPGDELLLFSHAYHACRNALEFIANRDGAVVVRTPIPFPLRRPEEAADALLNRVTPRTKLALIDHITSPTALVLPMETILPALRERGVRTLVDGAHAPGMIPLDLDALAPDYYTGNAHKWLCAPKGAAFLYAAPGRDEGLHPTVISHGYTTDFRPAPRWHQEFDWCGTDDPTAILSLPESIRYLQSLFPDGLAGLMRHNHERTLWALSRAVEALGIEPPCPETMLGSMVALPLPPSWSDRFGGDWERGKADLWNRFRIEIPVTHVKGETGPLLRISSQVYNSQAQVDYLLWAVREQMDGR